MPAEDDHAVIGAAIAGHGDIDRAIDLVDAMSAEQPARGLFAAQLIEAMLQAGFADQGTSERSRVNRVARLLAIVEENPPVGPNWQRLRALAGGMTMVAAPVYGRPVDQATALAQLDESAAEMADNPQVLALLGYARMVVAFQAGASWDDGSMYIEAPAQMANLRDTFGNLPNVGPALDALDGAFQLLIAHQRGEDLQPALDEASRRVDRLPEGNVMRQAFGDLLATWNPVKELIVDPDGAIDTSDEKLAGLRELADSPDRNDSQRAMAHCTLGGTLLGAGLETDLDRVAAAVGHSRTAVDLAPPNDPNRAFFLLSLGLALWRQSELTNEYETVIAARDAMRAAREAAGGEQHRDWSFINEMLAQVERRLGVPDARMTALQGLRNNAWRVLLQSDARAARHAARDAAQSAADAARQCLANDAPADAIRALDAGRSLMLFSAAEFRDIVPRLVEVGRPDLAERWAEAATADQPDELPAALRHDVLTALIEASDILDPPSLPEIRQALRTLDADALVYLVPAPAPGQPGWAVIAPAHGSPSSVALMNLQVDDDDDVERFLAALTDRDLQPPRPRANLVGDLDMLCEWAWRAAIRSIVEDVLPTLPVPTSGRPYRLVLVPMGKLALIPWHAARRKDGRYAVQDVAFSIAASARLLCRSAAQAPVALLATGLVVGDPDTGTENRRLAAARVEAYAIHRAFYRGGRYIGTRADGSRSPSGAGTADEVRAWLTDTRLSAGAMLHLACHGVIDTDPRTANSYLVLASGQHLAAEEIVQLLSRTPDRDIGLAVLAACRTGRAVSGYDEAYSLGTALLAGGVRTVLSTQWAVPDDATSLMMFMFHHYLMIDRMPAWSALRHAQLWMLDPERQAPSTMPPALQRRLATTDMRRIEAWAGFVHLGQ